MRKTTIGYVHIDGCELRHADGKIHMFLAIGRVSKFTFRVLQGRQDERRGFARERHRGVPYEIHTVLTDNGIAVADLPKTRRGATAYGSGGHTSGAPAPTTASPTS